MTRINKETQIITDDFTLDEDFINTTKIDGVLNFHFYEDDDKIVNLMIGTKNLGYISVDALKDFLQETLQQLEVFTVQIISNQQGEKTN